MPWFKVDDGFANSQEVMRIPRRHRCAAAGLYTLAGSWAAKELTDGWVRQYMLAELCGTKAVIHLLVMSPVGRLYEEVPGALVSSR